MAKVYFLGHTIHIHTGIQLRRHSVSSPNIESIAVESAAFIHPISSPEEKNRSLIKTMNQSEARERGVGGRENLIEYSSFYD